MATETAKLWQMYEKLKYHFLFNNDINSIYILLNLYDLEENITNICPKYVCIKDIKKRIKFLLRYREDRDLIANKISYLVHEDIDRLELCVYLEGYKYGYFNNKWVNILEEKTLNYFDIGEIYEKKSLFHYDFENEGISNLKNEFEIEIDNIEKDNKYIEDLINCFSKELIKNKIDNLNDYVDIQLKIDFNSKLTVQEEMKIPEDELNKIYNLIVKYLYKNIMKIYKDASWFGLNDKVLKRYS